MSSSNLQLKVLVAPAAPTAPQHQPVESPESLTVIDATVSMSSPPVTNITPNDIDATTPTNGVSLPHLPIPQQHQPGVRVHHESGDYMALQSPMPNVPQQQAWSPANANVIPSSSSTSVAIDGTSYGNGNNGGKDHVQVLATAVVPIASDVPPTTPLVSSSSPSAAATTPLIGSAVGEHSSVVRWWSQFQALLRKNYQVLIRQWKSSLYLLIGPLVFLVIILIISSAITINDQDPLLTRYDTQTLTISKCESIDVYGRMYARSDNPCVTLIYAPDVSPYTEIMHDVRDRLGYNTYDVQGFTTDDEMIYWMYDNMGSADTAINFNRVFNVIKSNYSNPNHRVVYELWYNTTFSSSRAVAFQSQIDTSILKILKTQKNVETSQSSSSLDAAAINIGFQMIPPVMTRVKQTTTGMNYGDDDTDKLVNFGLALALVIGVTITALLTIQTITTEKKDKLLGRMRIMGLKESAYWSTWFITYTSFAIVAALIVPAIGQATDWPVYTRASYGVHVLIMFMFIFSITSLALCISSCVQQPRWVNVASVVLFFVAMFTSIFPVAQLQNLYYTSATTNIARFIYWCFPWFHFNKSFGDIIRETNSQLLNAGTENQTRIYPSFSSDMMYDQQYYPKCDPAPICCNVLNETSGTYSWDDTLCLPAPSISYAMLMQLSLAVVYLVLAWYIGQLGGDLGASQKWYFPLSPTYWGCGDKKKRESLIEGDTLSREQITSREQRSVRTYKISKAFKDQSAVKEVTLEMNRGECFVLLGHNGAGKTTMINMLTGLFPPTYGEGFIFGMDIRHDIAQIQQCMGICPQDNWLWPQLTSFEHLLLFAALRGLPRDTWSHTIAAKLSEFHLNDLINTPTAKLSGGMKRRLSLAMATLGAPDIIFLDEPTTGMDPVNKHKVWNAIANLKRNKVVVLTTHSMEEADFLGDKIAMMSGGRLRAMGTSLFLKNHFGSGYQIHLLAAPSSIPQLETVVKELLPSAEIVGNAGGNLTVALPRKSVRRIPEFFRWIDQAKMKGAATAASGVAGAMAGATVDSDGIMVKEWSISNSTLEEVFLRLCSAEKGVNESLVDFGKNNNDDNNDEKHQPRRVCILCNQRDAQTVTFFTRTGVAVQCPNIICMICCMGPEYEAEEKKKQQSEMKEIEDGTSNQEGMFDDELPQSSPITTGTTAAATTTPTIAYVEPPNTASVQTTASSNNNETKDSNDAPIGKVSSSPSSPMSPISPVSPAIAVNGGSGTAGLSGAVGVRPPTLCQQIRAVFLKNFALALAEKKTWIFKLILLIVVAALLGTNLGAEKDTTLCSDRRSQDDYYDKWPCERQEWFDLWRNRLYAWQFDKIQMGLYFRDQIWVPANFTNGIYRPGYYINDEPYEVPTWGMESASWDVKANHIRYHDSIVSGDTSWSTLNVSALFPTPSIRSSRNAPFAVFSNTSTSDVDAEIAANAAYVRAQATKTGQSPLCFGTDGNMYPWYYTFSQNEATRLAYSLFADSYLIMNRFDLNSLILDYKIKMWDNDYSTVDWRTGEFGISSNGSDYYYCYAPRSTVTPWGDLPQMVNSISNTIAKTILWNDSYVGTTFVPFRPGKFVPLMTEVTIAQSLAGLTFITMLLWPTFVYRIIYEREEQLFHMMRISGMKTSTYWIAEYLFDFAMQIMWSILFLVIPTALGASIIVYPGFGIHFLVLVCYAHSLMGMTSLLSAVFTSRRTAAVIGYFIVIVSAALAAVLTLLMTSTHWPTWMFIFPPLAYIRSLDLAVRYGERSFADNDDMKTAIIALIVAGTVYGIIGIYLSTIKYRSALYIFDSCARKKSVHSDDTDANYAVATNNNNSNGRPNKGDVAMIPLGGSAAANSNEDIDVRNERERIMSSRWGATGQPAIVIRNLVKSFAKSGTEKNDKLAVNHICLGIDSGECFGLLGPNGAGKTTTLSILSGLLDQTSGTVRVGAYDTRTEIDLVYTILGICPQFDTVWEDLSIRDHFLFYARLKGASREYEQALAQRQAEMVDLDGDAFNKNASSLSGGMKRRLSIGISLIGNPKVWLLDEPSTGLSPEARRQVWDIVSKQRKVGRTVIITTHSMEEADTLCSRIGIVAKGQLKCLGVQSHLKARFGDGFKLTFNMDHTTTRRIGEAPLAIEADSKDVQRDIQLDSYVINELGCRGAVLTGAVGKNMVYTLPKDGAATEDVLRIFNAMERKQAAMKLRFGIVEWGVQQSSLEEVFMSVVDQAERDELNASDAL